MAGALDGIRVVDLSRVLGGPYCTQVLADHGAEVIKVEPPMGDETRAWGPPFDADTSSYFMGVNRNKYGISLDLSTQEGREDLLVLLEGADVLVENFKTGTLEKWGLGYEDVLSKRFPRLIHCQVTGFGDDGPLGGLPGYDAILQAMCGLMSINGEKGGDPLRMGVPIIDLVTGLNAVIGVLMALNERGESGLGQSVQAALFDTGLALLHPHAANHFLDGRIPKQTGNAHPNISPYSAFPTRTCFIFLAVGNDRQFQKLCQALDAGHLASDARFLSNNGRVTHREALQKELEHLFADRDGEEISALLIKQGVPAGSALNVQQAVSLPHTDHREMVVGVGDYKGIGSPIKLSRSKPNYRLPPPRHGEHNAEILPKRQTSDKPK